MTLLAYDLPRAAPSERSMRRREFITLLDGAAATWPLTACAEQLKPVVGLLTGAVLSEDVARIDALRQGLVSAGFRENHNVAFLYRGATGHYDQLSTLAAELVKSEVAVIASLGPTFSGLAKTRLLRCMSREVARLGPLAMSPFAPLLGA
jgi:hypothetical protein